MCFLCVNNLLKRPLRSASCPYKLPECYFSQTALLWRGVVTPSFCLDKTDTVIKHHVMERKWRSADSSLISVRNSRIHYSLESVHTPSWSVQRVLWNHIARNTAVDLTHVLLTVEFAEKCTHFDWLTSSYNYGEFSRDIKNTLKMKAFLLFHTMRTVRFQLVIVLVINFSGTAHERMSAC